MTQGEGGGRPTYWRDDLPDLIDAYTKQAVTKWEVAERPTIQDLEGGMQKEVMKKFVAEIPSFPTAPGFVVWLWTEKKINVKRDALRKWIEGAFPECVKEEVREKFFASWGRMMATQEEILSVCGAFGMMKAQMTQFLLSANHGYIAKSVVAPEGDSAGHFGMTSKEIREAEE